MPVPPRCSLILTRPEAKQPSPHIPILTLLDPTSPFAPRGLGEGQRHLPERPGTKAPTVPKRLSLATRTKGAVTDERVPTPAGARVATEANAEHPGARTYDKDGNGEPIPQSDGPTRTGPHAQPPHPGRVQALAADLPLSRFLFATRGPQAG